ncbi:unnamed protein product [Didymodactylos carnosus]|uniref:J domain-containing protein n=1 Tax=Didymodactylos carnosus TaxID=1234261 RepID=A0A8S2N3U2_9BILA|nr:unnamed protein product [Didymodactylos carnosus]CAF3988388.1 unnamed protein product [Didymodactylos carnosus]
MDSKADHYKPLGIEANASEAAIRQAYKKKALEWHPDKRGNDVHADRMFKEIKKAYETLSNDLTKFEYDAKREDNDDTVLLDAFQLPSSKRPSQVYEEKLTAWIDEYPHRTFIDNVDAAIESITIAILDKYRDDFNATSLLPTVCSICSEQCHDVTDQFGTKRMTYMTSLKKMNASNPSLNEQLAALAPDDWSWKPIDPAAPIF